MRTEHTRQTRWAARPEAVDPAQVPPGSSYVRETVWVPCTECDLQVHAMLVEWLTAGVRCPECGRLLSFPLPREEQEAALGKVEREEDRFRRRTQP